MEEDNRSDEDKKPAAKDFAPGASNNSDSSQEGNPQENGGNPPSMAAAAGNNRFADEERAANRLRLAALSASIEVGQREADEMHQKNSPVYERLLEQYSLSTTAQLEDAGNTMQTLQGRNQTLFEFFLEHRSDQGEAAMREAGQGEDEAGPAIALAEAASDSSSEVNSTASLLSAQNEVARRSAEDQTIIGEGQERSMRQGRREEADLSEDDGEEEIEEEDSNNGSSRSASARSSQPHSPSSSP